MTITKQQEEQLRSIHVTITLISDAWRAINNGELALDDEGNPVYEWDLPELESFVVEDVKSVLDSIFHDKEDHNDQKTTGMGESM